jgi:hypothetical protein
MWASSALSSGPLLVVGPVDAGTVVVVDVVGTTVAKLVDVNGADDAESADLLGEDEQLATMQTHPVSSASRTVVAISIHPCPRQLRRRRRSRYADDVPR